MLPAKFFLGVDEGGETFGGITPDSGTLDPKLQDWFWFATAVSCSSEVG